MTIGVVFRSAANEPFFHSVDVKESLEFGLAADSDLTDLALHSVVFLTVRKDQLDIVDPFLDIFVHIVAKFLLEVSKGYLHS